MSHVITRERPGLDELVHAVSAVDAVAIRITTLPAPVITSISPTEYEEKNAFKLTVEGQNFTAKHTVEIGALDCTTTHTSATKLEADIPATNAGSYVITVKGPLGRSNEKTLTITAKPKKVPEITSIDPDHHVAGESFPMAVKGANFNDESQVYIGAAHLTTTRQSSWRLDATVPGGLDGPHDYQVTVRDDDGESKPVTLTITAKPTIAAATIDELRPSEVDENYSRTIEIHGSNIDPRGDLYVDSTQHSELVTDRNPPVEFKLGGRWSPGNSPYSIKWKNPGAPPSNGKLLTIKEAYRPPAKPAPYISSISPVHATYGERFTLDVYGSHFERGAQISVGGSPEQTDYHDSQHLSTVIGSGWPDGEFAVAVTNPDRQVSDDKPLLHVDKAQHEDTAFAISYLDPRSHPAHDAFTLHVHGSGFENGDRVLVESNDGTYAGLRAEYHSSEYISRACNDGWEPGTRKVTVEKPNGRRADPVSFEFTGSRRPSETAPYIARIHPESHPEKEAFTLEVHGQNFVEGAKVWVGQWAADTRIQKLGHTPLFRPMTDSWAAGTYAVKVVNPNGEPSNEKQLTLTARSEQPATWHPHLDSLTPDRAPRLNDVLFKIVGEELAWGGKLMGRFHVAEEAGLKLDIAKIEGGWVHQIDGGHIEFKLQWLRTPITDITWLAPDGQESNPLYLHWQQ